LPPETLVSLREVNVVYTRRARFGRARSEVRALDAVSLEIAAGSILGVSGPSECGKSTLARCIAAWQRPTSGEIVRRGSAQLVMQDPGASLNPRFTAAEVIDEPLLLAGSPNRQQRVDALLEAVKLDPLHRRRRSGEFSGGQRARLAIARALAVMPALLILDESLSSLDHKTRAQIVALLLDLKSQFGLTYLLISHDEDLVAGIAPERIVMREGRIVT